MSNLDSYIKFMEQETALGNRERASFGNMSEISTLTRMIEEKKDFPEIENFILKNIRVLFDYAPHFSIQVYLASISTSIAAAYEVIPKLEALLTREDLPAKSFSVINNYISLLKQRDTTPPSMSVASDEKILEALNTITPERISSLMLLIQLRLQMGEKLDHFVDLLNPFMSNTSVDPIYKVTILQQLAQIGKTSPATTPFSININGDIYQVLLDGSLEIELDPFLRGVNYYADKLNLPSTVRELTVSLAQMYRLLRYNTKNILNTEVDVKSFCLCLIEAYNINVAAFSPSSVVSIKIPNEYREAEGFKEATKFLYVAYRPRYI